MPKKEDELDASLLLEQIKEAMEHFQVPGVAVGLLHGDKTFISGLGVTNVNHPLAVKADTLFQIGSITKTFVATTVMRLVDMGKLDIDAPVRTYLPDFRLADEDTARRVTLRHLLTHTGGWEGDYFDDLGEGDDALKRYVANMAELKQLTPLGEVWSYNNAGFNLAGRVIEVATGKTFETVVKELIFDPLGMKQTFFFPQDVMIHRFVVGHTVTDDGPAVLPPWLLGRSSNPAGGIVSTVNDMLLYARFQIGDGTAPNGTRLLKPESLALMHTPLVASGNNFSEHVGLVWWVDDMDGVRTLAHGGSTTGQEAKLLLAPERQFAIVVLTNCGSGERLHSEVTTWALQHYLGASKPEPKLMDVPREKLTAYTGSYTSRLSNAIIEMGKDGLVLRIESKGGFPSKDTPPPAEPFTPPVRLAFYENDRVIMLDQPLKDNRGEFLRSPDGSIAWFRVQGRIHRKV